MRKTKPLVKAKLKKIINTAGKVLNVLLLILLSAVLIYNLYNLFFRIVKKDTLPKVFGTATAVVVSGSMSPTINVGDMVIIKEYDSYSVRDIITFKQGNIYITHRIIEITETGYVTQGDFTASRDEGDVPFEAVQGKVIYTVRFVGKVFAFLQQPFGMLIILIAGAIIIYLPGAINAAKRKKDKTDGGQQKG